MVALVCAPKSKYIKMGKLRCGEMVGRELRFEEKR